MPTALSVCLSLSVFAPADTLDAFLCFPAKWGAHATKFDLVRHLMCFGIKVTPNKNNCVLAQYLYVVCHNITKQVVNLLLRDLELVPLIVTIHNHLAAVF